jgi:transposase
VALEATYGWYWAADVAAEAGAVVHLAHPLGVTAFTWQRVKTDERDARLLAELLRAGALPEAWIAPVAVRELRELVRFRHRLVELRTGLKDQVHGVLAKHGLLLQGSDPSGVGGRQRLRRLDLPEADAQRIRGCLALTDHIDALVDQLEDATRKRLDEHAGFKAIQQIPGVGPILAAVFVAEIGDVARFAGPGRLCCWAG